MKGQGLEANFDLFRETFVLLDLDIDLFFTTEASTLEDKTVQAKPAIYMADPRKIEDGVLSLSGE